MPALRHVGDRPVLDKPVLITMLSGWIDASGAANSAIEALCDFVETRHNEKIGIIKDIAAAGVGIAMFAWLLVLGFEVEEMLRAIF